MGELYDAITGFFQQENWPYIEIAGRPVLQLTFQGDNGQWTCFAHMREERSQFLFYSICPVSAPTGKRLSVAEFLSRANFGLLIGNLEMDFDDGEIRCRTGLGVQGIELNPALIGQLVYANVYAMDRYLPGLLQVLYGNVPPAEAIAAVENAAPVENTAAVENPEPVPQA